jgi:hypothetical protein
VHHLGLRRLPAPRQERERDSREDSSHAHPLTLPAINPAM